MSSEDYYEILGLMKPSDPTEIRKAYHKLALKFHPDKNKSPEAAELFKKINEAYDVLSTPEKKEIYDKFGKDGLNKNNIHFDEGNIFNIFSSVFGGQQFPFGTQFAFNVNNMRVNHLEIVEEIKLSEIFTGKKVSKVIERNSICAQCKGTGSDDGKTRICKICSGRKFVQQQHRMGSMITIQQIQCPRCQGMGVDNTEHACSKCKGTKISKDKHTIRFEIPVGHMENDVIVMRNEGHHSPENPNRGDIVIKICILQDETFLRNAVIKGRKLAPVDLLTFIQISLAESLCGFERQLKLPDCIGLSLQFSEIIKDDDVYIVENKGLPMKHNSGFGKLFIVFKVDMNITLNPEKKMIIWELLTNTQYSEKIYTIPPRISKLS